MGGCYTDGCHHRDLSGPLCAQEEGVVVVGRRVRPQLAPCKVEKIVVGLFCPSHWHTFIVIVVVSLIPLFNSFSNLPLAK